jgi:quercetin dioxygenase-like cupin family protein
MTAQANGISDKHHPATLADMVEYQDGSVVSHALVKKKAGTVTVFAFAEGEGLSEHTAPYDALVHILDGEAEIGIAGAQHRLGNGDFIIMPANVPHSVHAGSRFKMLLTMIRESGEATETS